MSGETQRNESGWTTDTLKQHYDSLREADKDALAAALQAVKEDNEKTALAFEKRFDSVNEFRAQLSDQANTFLTRVEYHAAHQSLVEKIDALTDRINRSEGQSQGSDLTVGKVYAAIGAVGVVLGIVVVLANTLL